MKGICGSVRGGLTLVAVLVALAVPAAAYAQGNTEANKAAVATLMEIVSDPSRIDEMDGLLADDFVVDMGSGDLDAADFKAGTIAFGAAMPDAAYEPLIVLADGDRVALRYQLSGTFTEPLSTPDGMNLQPTGKPVALTSNAFVTFDEAGKITGYQEVFDNLAFLTQLGAIPAQEGAMTTTTTSEDPATWTIAPTTADFTAALKDRLLAAIQAAYGTGDMAALDSALAADYVSHPTGVDLAATKAQIEALRAAIPDLAVATDIAVAEGDWIAYQWTASGTFTDALDLGGTQFPPTNQPVTLEGITLAVAGDDGKVEADWNEIDNLSLGMQLGMIPSGSEQPATSPSPGG